MVKETMDTIEFLKKLDESLESTRGLERVYAPGSEDELQHRYGGIIGRHGMTRGAIDAIIQVEQAKKEKIASDSQSDEKLTATKAVDIDEDELLGKINEVLYAMDKQDLSLVSMDELIDGIGASGVLDIRDGDSVLTIGEIANIIIENDAGKMSAEKASLNEDPDPWNIGEEIEEVDDGGAPGDQMVQERGVHEIINSINSILSEMRQDDRRVTEDRLSCILGDDEMSRLRSGKSELTDDNIVDRVLAYEEEIENIIEGSSAADEDDRRATDRFPVVQGAPNYVEEPETPQEHEEAIQENAERTALKAAANESTAEEETAEEAAEEALQAQPAAEGEETPAEELSEEEQAQGADAVALMKKLLGLDEDVELPKEVDIKKMLDLVIYVARTNDKLQQATEKIVELEENIFAKNTDWTKDKGYFESILDEKADELNKLTEQLKDAQEGGAALASENQERTKVLEAQIATLEEELAQKKGEMVGLSGKLVSLDLQKAEAEADRDAAVAAFEQQSKALGSLEQRETNRAAEAAQLRERLATAEGDRQSLLNKTQELTRDALTAKEWIERLKGKVATEREIVSGLAEAKESLEQQVRDAQLQLKGAEETGAKALGEAQETMQQLTAELAQVRTLAADKERKADRALAEALRKNTELAGENTSRQERVKAMMTANAEEMIKIKGELARAKGTIAALEARTGDTTELEALRARLEAVVTENGTLNTKGDALTELNEQNFKAAMAWKGTASAFKAEATSKNEEIEKLMAQMNAEKEKRTELEKTLAERDAEVTQWMGAYDAAMVAGQELKAEVERLQEKRG